MHSFIPHDRIRKTPTFGQHLICAALIVLVFFLTGAMLQAMQ